MSALIAIVGRPNVGKSALFNRIVGRRIAIVHDEPGVTRDRISAEAEWRGRSFTLVDTGGLGLVRGEKAADAITAAVFEQIKIAIASADVIVLVVNVQEGVMPLDREVAGRLREFGKPVLVAVNKADNETAEADASEFAELGFEKTFPVSAIHGRGVESLLNEAASLLMQSDKRQVTRDSDSLTGEAEKILSPVTHLLSPVKLAIVGRPNVGKSSIINALTKSERVIVSPLPGTTRDAVDVPFAVVTDGVRQEYILIDTAGLRKPRRVGSSIEFFSVKRAEDSIARCDIAVLVLDAEAGITEQDKKVADIIVADRRACIVVINKWDLADAHVRRAREEELARRRTKERAGRGSRSLTTLAEFGQWVQEQLFFLDYAPVIFISAKSGFNLDRFLEAVRYVAAQLQQRIPTAILNRTLHDAVERRQPTSVKGHRLKFFYATQVKQTPPTFLLFVNHPELFSEQYRKFLGDQLRRAFGYEGCPLVLVAKPRAQTAMRGRRVRAMSSKARR